MADEQDVVGCGRCRFYQVARETLDYTQGMCTRFPPQMALAMSPQGPVPFTTFPTVRRDWQCGEYQPKFAVN